MIKSRTTKGIRGDGEVDGAAYRIEMVVSVCHVESLRCDVKAERTSLKGYVGRSIPGRGKGLNVCVPQNLYVEALIPNLMVREGRGLWKVIRSRWGHERRPLIMGSIFL